MIGWLASGRLAQIERFSIYNGHSLVYWTACIDLRGSAPRRTEEQRSWIAPDIEKPY
jgi:hypothetical protein